MKKLSWNHHGFGVHGVLLLITGLVALIAIGFFAYARFNKLTTYTYTAPKGQKYQLDFFRNSKIVDSGEIAKLLSNDLKPGNQVLAEEKEFGLILHISPYITRSTPPTKTCTDTEGFAFNIGDYEVCKTLVDQGNTHMLLAKLVVDGKYFIAFITHKYDGDRILKDRDSNYLKKFREIDLMKRQTELEKIFRSIKPL